MKSIPDYLNALEQEMRSTAAAVKAAGRRVVAVYIGGGTPTTLSAAQLRRLMEALRTHIDLTELVEYTVKAAAGHASMPKSSKRSRPWAAAA